MPKRQGDIFREYIENKGLKDTEVARLLNVSSEQVSNYYLSKSFQKPTLKKIKAVFTDFILNNIEINYPYNEEKRGNNSTTLNKNGVPYYDIDVNASIISGFSDVREDPEFYVDYRPFNDCSAYVPVFGDSMYPRYASGEVIAVKQVENPDYIQWGEAHLIITDSHTNNMRVIKTIHPCDGDQSKIVLRSSNPNFKGDTIIPRESILSIYIVKGKVTRNQM